MISLKTLALCVTTACLAASLMGCAQPGPASTGQAQVLKLPAQGALEFTPQDKTRWESVRLPGKLATEFKLTQEGKRWATRAHAQSSASMLRQAVHVPADRLGRLQFEWQIEQLIARADMADRDTEDSPARLVLAFEGDRGQFSSKNASLSELTQALTGEPLPYATLMYVWCNHRPVGTVIINPRTDRVRKLVVESGAENVMQWRTYHRDIKKDFEQAFGEAPGALVGVGIMSDTDNTRSQAKAWYGHIRLD